MDVCCRPSNGDVEACCRLRYPSLSQTPSLLFILLRVMALYIFLSSLSNVLVSVVFSVILTRRF